MSASRRFVDVIILLAVYNDFVLYRKRQTNTSGSHGQELPLFVAFCRFLPHTRINFTAAMPFADKYVINVTSTHTSAHIQALTCLSNTHGRVFASIIASCDKSWPLKLMHTSNMKCLPATHSVSLTVSLDSVNGTQTFPLHR